MNASRRLRPILVVEDSDEDFATVLEALNRAGVGNEVHRAESGDDAMDQLLACAAKPASLPALVLMDLSTPRGDGRDALRQMQLNDQLRAVPVVVLSTSHNPRDVGFCYAQGANAFHVKPVQHPAHLALLAHIFEYWLTLAMLPD